MTGLLCTLAALPLFAAQILCLAVILIYSGAGKCFANTAAFTLFIAVSIPVNTVNLKMDVDLERAGGRLNYPLARGCGSLGFVVISTVLGLMMDAPQFGYISVPVGGLILILCEIPVHLWADRRLKALRAAGEKGGDSDAESAVESASSLPAFAKQNGRFCLMLLGTVLIDRRGVDYPLLRQRMPEGCLVRLMNAAPTNVLRQVRETGYAPLIELTDEADARGIETMHGTTGHWNRAVE